MLTKYQVIEDGIDLSGKHQLRIVIDDIGNTSFFGFKQTPSEEEIINAVNNYNDSMNIINIIE